MKSLGQISGSLIVLVLVLACADPHVPINAVDSMTLDDNTFEEIVTQDTSSSKDADNSALNSEVSGHAASAEPATSWTTDRYEYDSSDKSITTLNVINELGDVRIRKAKTDQFELLGILQYDASQSAAPIITIKQDGNVLRIEALGASSSSDKITNRVDISLLVPAHQSIQIRTASGLIRAKNINSSIAASSKDGLIEISTAGNFIINNEHGNVSATIIGELSTDPYFIKTQMGDIQLFIQPSADAEIAAQTAGHVTSDYSTVVEFNDNTDRKTVSVLVGTNTHEIELNSSKGNIQIFRSAIQ